MQISDEKIKIDEVTAEVMARPLDEVVIGRDLGVRAKAYYIKSTEAALEVAATVHKAMSLYYTPKQGKPKAILSDDEQYKADQWASFLEMASFEWSKHAKLLSNYNAIGAKAEILNANSANLPSSIETLAVIAKAAITPEALQEVLDSTAKESTTAEVKEIIQAVQSVTAVEVPHQDKSEHLLEHAAILALKEIMGWNLTKPEKARLNRDASLMDIYEFYRDSEELNGVKLILENLTDKLLSSDVKEAA